MRRAMFLSALLAAGCRFGVAGLPIRGADDGGGIPDLAVAPGDAATATPLDLAAAADLAAPLDLAVPPDLATPPSLSGQLVTVGTAIALTTEGTLDWAHWGLAAAGDFDHRALGGTRISDFTRIGTTATVFRYANDPRSYTWADGTPTAAATATPTGIYVPAATAGVRITAACDGSARTLRVYLTGWQSSAVLSARISDGSRTYTDQNAGSMSADYRPVYELVYRCGPPLDLEVSWSVNQNYGSSNVGIAAATLQ